MVEDHNTLEVKDDPKYTTFLVNLKIKKGNDKKDITLPSHKCTDEDWGEFYPP